METHIQGLNPSSDMHILMGVKEAASAIPGVMLADVFQLNEGLEVKYHLWPAQMGEQFANFGLYSKLCFLACLHSRQRT